VAKAETKDTSPSPAVEQWDIDQAFQYLTRVIGMQDGVARVALREAMRRGRLPVECRHYVDGELSWRGTLNAEFWDDHLTVEVVDGHAQIGYLKAFDPPGKYDYQVPAEMVRILWPFSAAKKQGSEPARTDIEPQHAAELQVATRGIEREVYEKMKSNPPRKGDREYTGRLWKTHFKQRVSLKRVQNLVGQYRRRFELPAEIPAKFPRGRAKR
jgi:hypothetical protein